MLDLDSDYINKDGKIIKREDLCYISRGVNASVWKYQVDNSLESMALKTFFSYTHKFCLNLKVYEKMKDLPLKNIIVPKDIYYKMSETPKSDEDFDAYLMSYLEENMNVLLSDVSLDSLLENITSLENDIKILAEYNILMNDIKLGNSIICKKKCQLHIIDIDMFSYIDENFFSDIDIYFSNYRTRKFNNFKENMYMLLSLIKSHFMYDIDGLCLSAEKKSSLKNYIYAYFSVDNLGNESITNHVERLFQGHDTPKEYFLKR